MRTSGILLPIFSLPGNYGIGTLGKEAYNFVDFLKKSKQSYWQILPLNPTNFGDSPYQTFSSFAGNPYFIDLDILCEEGLLKAEEIKGFDFGGNDHKINYEKLYKNRFSVLKIAFSRFNKENAEYKKFCKENEYWLNDYSLFMAIKDNNNGNSFDMWDAPLKYREEERLSKAKKEYENEVSFYKTINFWFFKQWMALKEYANKNGIKIIGDMPIYVAYDSADVWSKSEFFWLDNNLKPVSVAGCPPDAFSKDGQLWGNPLYDWKKMEEDGFSWWKNRLHFALNMLDIIRIDHFRGFQAYYAIPFGNKNAKRGKWIKGPNIKFFKELEKELGTLPIIAEDLGFLTKEVKTMLKKTGYPGMKVLQFAFDSKEESDYLPHNYTQNSVVYTGTHDNDTVLGWEKTAKSEDVLFAREYLNCKNSPLNWAMIRAALSSVSDTAILMMSDLTSSESEARINTPATLGDNWKWRIDKACINDWLAEIVAELTELYYRAPKK